MLGHDGYKKDLIRVMPDDTLEEGLIYKAADHLCVVEAKWCGEAGWYDVLHRPTGLRICHVYTRDLVWKVIEGLSGLAGLEEERPALDLRDEVYEIIDRAQYQAKKRTRKPQPTAPPLELEPYYPGRTPGVAVRAADRQLAAKLVAGEPCGEALDKATEIAWWESVMVRVNGKLLEGDVPKRAPIKLRDGTPATWEGFKASFAKLNAYGDDLLNLALEIEDLFLESEWSDADEREFDRLDEQFRTVVCAAWMEWTACVAHFLGSPPIRQKQVRDRLGFIGSEERGWHELGMKSFLRHPEILKACKLRRQGRIRVMGALAE